VKVTRFFLAASLIGNVALLAFLVSRRPSSQNPVVADGTTPLPQQSTGTSAESLRAALASGDAAALQAAGVSADVARDLALGRTFAKTADRLRATQSKGSADSRWWRNRPGANGPREPQLQARRELSDALIAAFGDDFGIGGGDQSQLAFLQPGKRDALRHIIQDYDEMIAKFSPGGVQLASDREKLRLLRAEREHDIAKLLTAEELMAYEMRTSPSAATVRNRYGDAIGTEAEFQKLYALQKAFDEKYPREALTGRISPEVLRARADAERQLESEFRAAVGDERYAALRRAADPDLRTLDGLVSRLSLPSTTTDRIMTSRETLATESQRIAADASVPLPQRRAQVQELATRAKADLTRTLGAEAAEAYAQRSPWLNLLQNGMAFSTVPQTGTPGSLFPGNQSVYPVPPAGAGGAGGRQVIFNASAEGPAGDGIGGSPRENVQVMTFGTSSTETGTSTTSSAKPIMIAPGGATAPASPSRP
jgi:hypothetical protein